MTRCEQVKHTWQRPGPQSVIPALTDVSLAHKWAE